MSPEQIASENVRAHDDTCHLHELLKVVTMAADLVDLRYSLDSALIDEMQNHLRRARIIALRLKRQARNLVELTLTTDELRRFGR